MSWFNRKKREDQEKGGTYVYQRDWHGIAKVKINDRELTKEKLEEDVISWMRESFEQKEKHGWEIVGLEIYGGAVTTTPDDPDTIAIFYTPFSLTVKERRKQHG